MLLQLILKLLALTVTKKCGTKNRKIDLQELGLLYRTLYIFDNHLQCNKHLNIVLP